MRHVTNILRYGQADPGAIHLAGANSHALCGMSLTKVIGKSAVPIAAEVDEPVSCSKCRKALEMVVRRRLDDLTAERLEQILEEIT